MATRHDGVEPRVDPAPPAPESLDERLARRVVIERIRPEIDGGRFAIKRTIGERVDVLADIFADGHDVIAAVLRDRHRLIAQTAEDAEDAETNILSAASAISAVKRDDWRETRMTLVTPGTDEWRASFETSAIGWHDYSIVAWADRFLTWRRDVEAKA